MSWAGAFAELPREHGFEPLRVEGAVPPGLRGTLYRCGPAATSCFGHRYRHFFDGDGAVTAVRFDGGRAWGAVRMVDTPGRIEERAAGRALHPAYGTLPPGPARPWPRPRHAANISVLPDGDRILALHEAGAPVALTADLHTIGDDDLGAPELRRGFSAHPHAVPARGAIYNVGVHHGRVTELALFELRDRRARRLGTALLAGPTMIHDFAATERHLIVFAPPLRLDLHAFASGLVPYGDALDWRPALGTEILVIPIDDPAATIRFTVEPFFQWHLVSARDRGDTTIVDLVRYPDFASNRWIGGLPRGAVAEAAPGRLARATIDRAARTARLEELADVALEFPTVAAGEPDRVYAIAHGSGLASGPFDRVVAIDLPRGRTRMVALGDEQYPSEPLHVPGPDGGWLVTLVYDAAAHASHVAVLAAADLRPIARAWFEHHIPYTLHGAWVP